MTFNEGTVSAQSAPQSKERPILFSGAMVRAILEGRKTQTRRLLKAQPVEDPTYRGGWAIKTHRATTSLQSINEGVYPEECPFGKIADRLWVREGLHRPDGDPWLYRADNQAVVVDAENETAMLVWAHHKQQNYCPSIHMPRWASRLTLQVTGVRVERLIEISESDAQAEGASDTFSREKCPGFIDDMRYTTTFASLWDSIHGDGAWALNPWVWMIQFANTEPAA